MNQKLTIDIRGCCGSGKTTLAAALRNLLEANGHNVIVHDSETFEDERPFPMPVVPQLQRIGPRDITITTTQIQRRSPREH